MIKLWEWVKDNPIRSMFLIPILLVAGISISHVVSWYDIANPFSWAIYLSIAIEIGAMTALIAATNRIKGGVWFMFGIVTFIQMIGNIFFSFKEIDANGDLFKSWVELTGPIWESLGSDTTDVISMKRWLAFLEGGLLPIISLTSLHFFVKYDDEKTKQIDDEIVSEVETRINKDNKDEHTDQVPTKYPPNTDQVTDKDLYFEENRFFVDDDVEEILTTTTTKKIEKIRRTPLPDGYIIGKSFQTTTTTTEPNNRILKYTKEG
jgi:hypothetical protein